MSYRIDFKTFNIYSLQLDIFILFCKFCYLLKQLRFGLAAYKRNPLVIFNLFFSANNNSEVDSPD